MVNDSIARLLIPPYRCILCQRHGQPHLDLCSGCQQDLPQLTAPACSRCSLPLVTTAEQQPLQCARCIKKTPSFNKLVAAWRYQPPIDELINQFKSQSQLSQGRVLSHLLGNKIIGAYPRQLPELIIPTPLHWRRLFSRGYNQSELIAQHLAKQLKLPIARPIKRRLHTPKQQSLTASQRQQNLRLAFRVDKPQLIKGRRIALIDDVVTTGATVEALSQCLIQAGAKEIDVWCLARTPLPA